MLTHRHATIIGDIPNDWEAKSLRQLLIKHAGGDWGDDEGEQEVRYWRSTNFTSTGYLNFDDVEMRYFTAQKAAQFALKEDDILLERSGGGPTQPVGRIGIIESDLPQHWFSNFVATAKAYRGRDRSWLPGLGALRTKPKRNCSEVATPNNTDEEPGLSRLHSDYRAAASA